MYDVIIVGAGPAGLTAAANTAHRGLKSLILDKQATPGGLNLPGVVQVASDRALSELLLG